MRKLRDGAVAALALPPAPPLVGRRPPGPLVSTADRRTDADTRFDPVCATFTFHWFEPEKRKERPFVSRAAIFMVPETTERTRFHVFLFLKLSGALLRAARPVVRKVALDIAKGEIEADAAFVPRPPARPRAAWEGTRPFTVVSRAAAGGSAVAFVLKPEDGLPLPKSLMS